MDDKDKKNITSDIKIRKKQDPVSADEIAANEIAANETKNNETKYEIDKNIIKKAFKGKISIIIGIILLVCFIAGSCILIFSGKYSLNEKAAHSYYGFDSPYGKGDYLYSTVTFTGDGLENERVLTVKDIEKLAFDSEKQIGFQNKYSMLSEDGTFVKHRYVGAKLYKLLLYLGMKEKTPDDTPITVYGKTGKVFHYKLADLKSHNNSRYKKIGSSSYQETDLETILAFGTDSLPLTGPVGEQSNDVVLSKKDGYIEKIDNSGGPVRFITGQKNSSDANSARSGKNIKKIVVGKEVKKAVNTGEKASAKQLTVSLYKGDKSQITKKTYSLAEIEQFAMAEDKNMVGGFYKEKNYFYGADLKNFIRKTVGCSSAAGTVVFRYKDSSNEVVDLAYVMKPDCPYSSYFSSVEDRRITGVYPGIAYAKNCKAINGGKIYSLLPACSDKKTETTVKECEEIEIHLNAGKDSTQSISSCRINIFGEGVKKAKSFTISEIANGIRKMEMVDGKIKGASLAELLNEAGLSFDADKVKISNSKDYKIFDVNKIMNYDQNAVIGIFNNSKLINRKTGPIVLRGDKSLNSIVSIQVLPKSKYWNHLFGPYKKYLDSKLVITGKAVKEKTYTLEQLETLGYKYTVKDQYAAAGKGRVGFRGVILEKLIDDNLRKGAGKPKSITVTTTDGMENRIDVESVYSPIKSKVDTTQKRKTIIAYAQYGLPLVSGKKSKGYIKNNDGGPLKLVIENQPAKWSDHVVKIIVN